MPGFLIVNGGITHCDTSWNSHGWIDDPAHKIYIVSAGSGRYAIPGGEIELAPGHMYFIPGGRPHRYRTQTSLDVTWLHAHLSSPAVSQRVAACSRIAAWPLSAWAWWQPTWAAIPAWLASRNLADELRLEALATAACAAAIAGQDPGRALDPRLDAAQRWMEANCLRHPSLAEAARAAGFAPAVFQRRFSAAAGQSPRAWMEARRLDHACRLLRMSDASVQEIAATCGYANAFHFSRVLRRRLGSSPRSLRARWAGRQP